MRKKSKYTSTAQDFRNMDVFSDTTGDRIRAARKRIGMSADRLAVQVGCSQSTISQYERGVRDPSPRMLSAIAKALEVREYELYTSDYYERYKLNFVVENGGEENFFSAYTNGYSISQEEYIRFSISYEKLDTDARRKVMEYAEDMARIPEYLTEVPET